MAKILITGGTGLVGRHLSKLLTEKNHITTILTRNPTKENEFKWDYKNNYVDTIAFEDIDYIIHLAGAGIADKRWTAERKKVIIDSRVETANLLFKKIKQLKKPLKGFLSASGSNYYGVQTTDKIFTEKDSAGNDFLGQVCKQWENAVKQFETLNIPVTILRTGIVLDHEGGALEKMITPVICPLGSGKQYMPWIHIEDLCQIYIHLLETNNNGVFNAIAPEILTNKVFSKTLAETTKRPFLPIHVPDFVLKLVFGELAIILLEGSKLSTKKIENDGGYSFRFKKLPKALKDLF